MKTKDKMLYFGSLLVSALIIILSGCKDFKYDTYAVTDKPYVDKTSVELYLGSDDARLASIQLTGSPSNMTFTWTSQNESVATVTQNGLVTARGEGYTNIVVASENDQFMVNVHVMQWVPIESITLDADTIRKFWYGVIDRFKINALFEPANTTETNLVEWSASSDTVAMVTPEGWVTYINTGKVTITAQVKDVKRSVEVLIMKLPVYKITDPEFIDRTNWKFPGYNQDSQDAQIGYSSQATNETPFPNGRVICMLDGLTNTFWHARWSPASSFPHWFIIDLGEETEIGGIMYYARENDTRGETGLQLFTTSMDLSNNLDALSELSVWENRGRFTYPPGGNTYRNFAILPPYPKARYVRVYFGPEYKGSIEFTMIAEFGLYRPKPDDEDEE